MAVTRPDVALPAATACFTVLGGSGFIGGALVRRLGALGADCRVPARGQEHLQRGALGHVIYAIGLTADFRTRPLDTMQAHVCTLRRLIAEADFDSLTYLSSTRVYAGGTDTRESADLRVNPNDASDLYNLSKLAGEALCLHAGRPGMKVARLSNVIGQRRDPDTFIDQLLLEATGTGRAVMRTAPAARKDYVALDDAVGLLLRIACSKTTGIFNVASGESVACGTVADLMRQVLGIEVTSRPDAPMWDFPPIDVGRVRREFGFQPRPFDAHFTEFLQARRLSAGTS